MVRNVLRWSVKRVAPYNFPYNKNFKKNEEIIIPMQLI